MIYLASPYAHPDPAVMEQRYHAAVMECHHNYLEKLPIYSPIVHNHPIALIGGLPRTWDFWKVIDLAMLRLCSTLWVLRLPGWEKSVGVTAEIEFAKDCGIPIFYIDPILCPPPLNPPTLSTQSSSTPTNSSSPGTTTGNSSGG